MIETEVQKWKETYTRSLQRFVKNEIPGGSVVKPLCFQCRGHGFDPCLRTKMSHAAQRGQKLIKKQ